MLQLWYNNFFLHTINTESSHVFAYYRFIILASPFVADLCIYNSIDIPNFYLLPETPLSLTPHLSRIAQDYS